MILCLSHTADFYNIDFVQQRITELGYESIRLNTDRFPVDHEISYTVSPGSTPILHVRSENIQINTNDVEAVWYRKIWPFTLSPDIPETYRGGVAAELQTTRTIFFEALAGVPWMNPLYTDIQVGGNKLAQLGAASAAGLTIPLTLMSNRPGEVKQFFEACNGKMITKIHNPLSYSMSGSGMNFPTTAIHREDLDDLDMLETCPMIFQEMIPKQCELRIAYADGDFFTGAINTQNSATGNTDWRFTNDMVVAWQHYALPETVKQQLHSMMQSLGLYFGAIDMIVTPEGKHVFLEVNPQGEWGMLQRDLDLPIGQTIAKKIIARIKK
jgi:glutathione synthase/RimK-type ligase-like ATP-grasp enzyme